MKKILYMLIGMVPLIVLAQDPSKEWLENYRQEESQQIQLWKGNLNSSEAMAPSEKMSLLWLGVRNIGTRMTWYYHDEEIEILYKELQEEVLSNPENIVYFTDEIERLKREVEGLPRAGRKWYDYDVARKNYIMETFPYLPSPETIRAIGEYLNDDFPPFPKGEASSGATPPNSTIASIALAKIGLVDPPAENLAAQRKWWEEVKSGKRTFAFLGKPVSYRFLPDGTTQTTPRDASRDPRRFPPPLDPGKSSQPPTAAIRMPWVIGGISLLLLGVLGYFLKRKSRV